MLVIFRKQIDPNNDVNQDFSFLALVSGYEHNCSVLQSITVHGINILTLNTMSAPFKLSTLLFYVLGNC